MTEQEQKSQPMKRQEILYAKRVIRLMHPLNNLDVELCLPFADPLLRCTKHIMRQNEWCGHKPSDAEEQAPLADADQFKPDPNNMDIQEDGSLPGEPKFDFFLDEGEDPMGRLGYGIVSYFQLIFTFLVIFFLLLCGHIPMMYNYATWKAYEGEKQLSLTTAFTIGNLGQSMPRCATMQMAGAALPIGCNTGLISNITHVGVYGFGSAAFDKGLCASNTNDDTGLDCESYSNLDGSLATAISDSCVGKQSCIMQNIHDYIATGTSPLDPGCTIDDKDTLYVQYFCQVPLEDLTTKRVEALQAGCAAIFACLVLLAVIKFRVDLMSIEKNAWDLETVTASDYTLEIQLSLAQVQEMRAKIYANSFAYNEISEGYKLKLWLIHRIEEQLDQLSGGAGGKVACVDFTYYNSWLLEGLRARGDCIKYQTWKEFNQVNRDLNEKVAADFKKLDENYYKADNEKVPTMFDPISAFVTMETEEAYNNLSGAGNITLGDEETEVVEALEPTNILWQNYDMDNLSRAARFLNIIITTTAVLGLVFVIAFVAKDAQKDLVGKYDVSIKCSELDKIYSEGQLTNLAADEWLDYYKHGGEETGRQINGNLACFCTKQYDEIGDDAAEQTYQSTDGTQVTTCSEIFADRGNAALIKSFVAILIVAVNFVLREVLVVMVKAMRLTNLTDETTWTMVCIFIGQFINTAALLTLGSANFYDIDGGYGPLSAIFVVGEETDFNVDWYRTVGALLMKTMFMTALWPLIELTMFYTIMNLQRAADRGFGSDTFKSELPTVQAYVDLYAGPEYLIHYRYSTILLNIFMAFLYGTSMPYLYFCAVLAFVILYINERLLVCYYYREPPTFDEKMTVMTLEFTKYVPLMMLPFAFWQLGNRQIFDDVVFEIVYKTDFLISGHDIQQALHDGANLSHWTYNSPPIFMFFLLLAWRVICFCWPAPSEEDEGDQLVEGLEVYYEALKASDKAKIQGQEDYYKYNFKTSTYSQESYDKLCGSSVEDKDNCFQGCATYRLLDNINYEQGFQYEGPIKQPDGSTKRDGVIKITTDETEGPIEGKELDLNQHDATYLGVNIAYMPDADARRLNFDTSDGKPLLK